MFGIAYNLTKNGKRAQLRIVMERVNCDGDMHDEIHAEEHWTCLRDNVCASVDPRHNLNSRAVCERLVVVCRVLTRERPSATNT